MLISPQLLTHGSGPVLLTRASDDQVKAVLAQHEGAELSAGCVLWRKPTPRTDHEVLVVTAGTADTAVADEAAITLAAYGHEPTRLHDVGVAGLHRLLAHLDQVTGADAIIVVAGMEGALASVIGGLTSGPVVAVPTSVGYGSGLEGVTALLAMHASCASGITVVNSASFTDEVGGCTLTARHAYHGLPTLALRLLSARQQSNLGNAMRELKVFVEGAPRR